MARKKVRVKRSSAVVVRCVLAGVAFVAGGGVASAAVITDPARVTGANAIDPAGGQTVDTVAPGAASQATLEADATFGAIQSFTSFAGGSQTPQNLVNYTDPTLPDISFRMTGTFAGAGSGAESGQGFTSAGLPTSDPDGLRLRVTTAANTGGTFVYTIDFGDNSSGTFNGTVNPVDKAGFTVSQFRTGHSLTVEFLNQAGAALSAQSVVGNDTDPNAGEAAGLDVLFAYDSDGTPTNAISSIRLTYTASAAVGNVSSFFDDLGFSAAIPEPGALGVVAAAGGAAMVRRRRRRD